MRKICLILLLLLLTPAHAFTVGASGQSNMCGRGLNGPSPLTADARVQVWNNTNELIDDGNAFIPVPDFSTPPWGVDRWAGANNLALWFADAAAQELNTDVKLVLVCRGARSLQEWMPGGEMYTAYKRIYLSTGQPPADVFLWHQGESDIDESACWYKTRFLRLLAIMRADGLLKYDAPAIIGSIVIGAPNADLKTTFNNTLYSLAMDHPDILYVNTSGASLHDINHFSGPGLYVVGRLYWDKYWSEAN